MIDNMVDDKDNHVDDVFRKTSWEVPLLLLGAFRTLIDDAHERLAQRGFRDVRPVHGFTLQALGDGASVTQVAHRLGVSKQRSAGSGRRCSTWASVAVSASTSGRGPRRRPRVRDRACSPAPAR